MFNYGKSGNNIKNIQLLLSNLGYKLKIDGIYGPETVSAVKNFQEDNGLIINGVITEDTFLKLLLENGVPYQTAYMNSKDLPSGTPYLIYVNLKAHNVYVYKGKNHNWVMVKKYLASVGKKETPTITGLFKIGAKGPGYGGKDYGFRVKWYTQFFHNYLFHSILYNLDGYTIFDGRLGQDISDGCIRLKEEDAKFIYDNVPSGSTVFIE